MAGSAKVQTDLNRDILWKPTEKRAFQGAAVISIDETWSAMRFRPKGLVGKVREVQFSADPIFEGLRRLRPAVRL